LHELAETTIKHWFKYSSSSSLFITHQPHIVGNEHKDQEQIPYLLDDLLVDSIIEYYLS